jgi:acyl carrier protein
MSAAHGERIRQILRDHALLDVDVDSIDDNTDLFDAGMDSQSAVNVMLALEMSFDVEFPESMLERGMFESISALGAAVRTLQAEAA